MSAPRRSRDLSTGEWAALALLVERPAHGFAVARALAPEGEVGRVWSLTRPLVYRALELLEREGLVERRGTVPGDGPARTVLAPTRKGRRRLARWLEDPVEHVRDARSELMLKLLYLDRAGADPSALLEAQLDALAPVERALAERVASSDGFERTLALWRLESTRALARVAAALLEATSPASPRSP